MKYLLLILSVALFSCSSEKRATKAIKRIGSKPMLKVLVLDYPELFTPTDSIIYVKIHDTVKVETKVVDIDTLLVNQPCQALNYEDKNLLLSYDNGVLNYRIKSKTIKTVYEKQVEVPHTCKPCPTVQIAQDIKNDYIKKSQPSQLEVIYKWWFWLCVVVLVLWGVKKFVKPI